MLLGINCKLDGTAVRGGESSPNFLAAVWLWELSCKRWHIFFVCWACGWIWIVRLGRGLRWETNVHCMVHVSICWPAGTKTWGTCQLQTTVRGPLPDLMQPPAPLLPAPSSPSTLCNLGSCKMRNQCVFLSLVRFLLPSLTLHEI